MCVIFIARTGTGNTQGDPTERSRGFSMDDLPKEYVTGDAELQECAAKVRRRRLVKGLCVF